LTEKLRADIAQLKAEVEEKNPKRPGRKRGKGIFRNRTALQKKTTATYLSKSR